jgi:hypothetical protein
VLGASVATASALVGLATGTVGLVRLFDDPPPPRRWGEIETLGARAMSFREYVVRQRGSTAAFTPERLRCPVVELRARMTTAGYAGTTLPVQWQVRTADGREVHTSRNTGSITPTADERRINDVYWAGLPVEGGRYTISVYLLDDNGVELDDAGAAVKTKPDQFGVVQAEECPYE